MSNSVNQVNAYFKPMLTGAIAAAGERFIFNEQDMNKSLFFGLSVAGGTYVGNMVGGYLPVVAPTVGFIDGKTLEVRLAEVGAGAASAYLINTQFLKNDFEYSQMYNKLALIAASDFVAEYIVDYMDNRPLSFFS